MLEREQLFESPEYRRDRLYVGYFIDSRYLGRKLGEGLETITYELAPGFDLGSVHADIFDPRAHFQEEAMQSHSTDRFVLKIPQLKHVQVAHRTQRHVEHYQTAMEYIEPYIVNPSYVLVRPDGKGYCILQRKMEDFEDLTPENIHLVSGEVVDFIARHQEMVRNGYFMDIVGLAGMAQCLKAAKDPRVQPAITNIVQEHGESVRLQAHDIAIHSLRRQESLSWVSYEFKKQAFLIDKQLMLEYFGFDVGDFRE